MKFNFLVIFCFLIPLHYCRSMADSHMKSSRLVAAELNKNLTDEEVFDQTMMLFIAPKSLGDKKFPLVGSLFFMDGNIPKSADGSVDGSSLQKNLAEIVEFYSNKKLPPPFTAIDQEGGTVRRLREPFFALPAALALGEYDDPAITAELAFMQCRKLLELGINWNLAPVADFLSNTDSEVVRSRAFGDEPGVVTRQSEAYIEGQTEAGCLHTMKHFPGHGGTSEDSHDTTPVLHKKYTQLFDFDMAPFRRMAGEGRLHTIMPGHLRVPAVDDQIVTFSSKWLREVLRQQLKFEGVLISDSLNMKGTGLTDLVEASIRTRRAGMDVLLMYDSDPEALAEKYQMVKQQTLTNPEIMKEVRASSSRVLALKLYYGIADPWLREIKASSSSSSLVAQIDEILSYNQGQKAQAKAKESSLTVEKKIRKITAETLRTLVGDPEQPACWLGQNKIYTDLNRQEIARISELSSYQFLAFEDLDAQKENAETVLILLNENKDLFTKLRVYRSLSPATRFCVLSNGRSFPFSAYTSFFGAQDTYISALAGTREGYLQLLELLKYEVLPPRSKIFSKDEKN